VAVSLVEDEIHWSPYLPIADAYKLDDVRDALCEGRLDAAAQYGRIYGMRPIAHQKALPALPGAVSVVQGR